MNEAPSLLRNDLKGTHHWLKVKLVGTKSNRSAMAPVCWHDYSGRVQAQAVLSQSSYYSCNDSRLHFGLGQATTADLTIHWPSGFVEKYPDVKCDQLITIREAHGIVPNAGWARS